MKYIKKIFENIDLGVILEDEFQSIKDLMEISDFEGVYMEVDENKIVYLHLESTTKDSGDYEDMVDNFDHISKYSLFMVELMNDLKIITSRLDYEGYNLDITFDIEQITIDVLSKESKMDKDSLYYSIKPEFKHSNNTTKLSLIIDLAKFSRWFMKQYNIPTWMFTSPGNTNATIGFYEQDIDRIDEICDDLNQKTSNLVFKDKSGKEFKPSLKLRKNTTNSMQLTDYHGQLKIINNI